jgi:hypothetical protein
MLIPLIGGTDDGAAYDTINKRLVGTEPTGTVDRTKSVYELQRTEFGWRYVFVFSRSVGGSDGDGFGTGSVGDAALV